MKELKGLKGLKSLKPKINLIIGKKQILAAGLTLILGTAIYVNYTFSAGNQLAIDVDEKIPVYGEAEYVSAPASAIINDDGYFAQARLAKAESRDEAREFLKSMINGGDVTDTEIAAISQDAANLSKYIEAESKIETVLKAQGFSDVLVYLSDKGANVIVKTPGLSASDAAKIKDVIIEEMKIPAEQITVVEVK
jgi:stage III sporulation protein AH